jgi:two-component system chemotaxis response regulator CheB
MKDPIRVLIVDDSPVVRTVLASMLGSQPGFVVVGQAQDGLEAVRLTANLRPDVITMDIRMPRMDGLEATRRIMSSTPTPIVVVASSVYATDLNIAFSAVEAGALTVVEKPHGLVAADYEAVSDQLLTSVRLMSDVHVVTLRPRGTTGTTRVLPEADLDRVDIIAIAASTGGPGVLHEILQGLPADFPIPIVLVQHITSGFVPGFVRWLDSVTALQVVSAKEGDRVAPGRVLVAPDDAHLTVTPGGVVSLERTEPIKGQRPSATRLFEAVAASYRNNALGIVLTGMGEDGADGLEVLRRYGGHVIAQAEAGCVVFGMPRAAIVRGLAHQVLNPTEIAEVLHAMSGRRYVQ